MSNDYGDGDKPRPNEPAYYTIDALNAARDIAAELEEKLQEVKRCLIVTAQSPEYRNGNHPDGLTQAQTVGVVEDLNAASASAAQAYESILRSLRSGQRLFSKAFELDHPKNPRGDYDDGPRGCSC